eukprot:487363-Pyramimonas_sp.AAC.1
MRALERCVTKTEGVYCLLCHLIGGIKEGQQLIGFDHLQNLCPLHQERHKHASQFSDLFFLHNHEDSHGRPSHARHSLPEVESIKVQLMRAVLVGARVKVFAWR